MPVLSAPYGVLAKRFVRHSKRTALLPFPSHDDACNHMYEHVYQHRVRYRACDPMGVVYHTHYLDYFEAARTEALREMGLVYRDLEASGVIMPVVDVQVAYKRPARYDDLLAITTQFEEVPRVRLPLHYEVRREGESDLLVTGRVTLCFVSTEHNRPISAPHAVRSVFDNALHAAVKH